MGREFNELEVQRPLLEGDKNGVGSAAQSAPVSVSTSKAPRVMLAPQSKGQVDEQPPYTAGKSGILPKAIVAVFIYFVVGTTFFYYEGNSLLGERTQVFIDALYICVVTLTTVGYGDLVPSSTAAKLFTCLYVLVGFGLVGALLGAGASYIVQKQEKILEKAVQRNNNLRLVGEEFLPEDEDVRSATWKAVISGMMILVLLTMGVTFLMSYEKFSLVDAVYCVCVTVTTLGYGDRSFRTAAGRLFAVVWILASTICAAQFFLSLSEVYTERQQANLVQWILNRKPTKVDLEAADYDKNHCVSAPEFVIMKLKEIGKIDEDDVTEILEHFNDLVQNPSDSITIQDSHLAQPS
ncbi:hypothetical protein R1flu_024634 [Riccia fluitans]|uniref:Potassium channel domain-containing protein n=1 Tax=Riccia fluitans TaxID=41844 RepID=A0ABD1XVM0_9MARC